MASPRRLPVPTSLEVKTPVRDPDDGCRQSEDEGGEVDDPEDRLGVWPSAMPAGLRHPPATSQPMIGKANPNAMPPANQRRLMLRAMKRIPSVFGRLFNGASATNAFNGSLMVGRIPVRPLTSRFARQRPFWLKCM